MAGRIREQSIAEVREKTRIEDVVSAHVTLRNAGGGSLKGLCPFHDEKTPSFNVRPSHGSYHCFGCQKSGGAIDFVMEIEGLGFVEAVERLADACGVALQREEGAADAPRGPKRGTLVAAHQVAQEFYAEQLLTPAAQPARQFLLERGFDASTAETFGLGFAPRDGEALFTHLRARGFTTDDLVVAGLVAVGRSPYDRFRGRLLWPIREAGGDTIGFGARRIFDDDRVEAKYLNTAETPIYKKSTVLYGIDLARKDMGRTSRAVVVEGYTDVMACHLAGVTTAVATCGTAFGDEHAKVLRRFMADHDEFRGEVVFTFDGDAAGQAAALKAFRGDAGFVSQTYVAVEPNGLDPCDLRIKEGDDAVRELVARRIPLYRFVLAQVLARYDLDRADARIDALREAARLVSSVRDKSKVDAFTRELSSLVGVDVEEARAEVRRALGRAGPSAPAATPRRTAGPDPRHPHVAVERETLKLVLQHPMVIGRTTAEVGPGDFTHPLYRAVWELVAAAGGPLAGADDPGWVDRVRDRSEDPATTAMVSELVVDSLLTAKAPDAAYVTQYVVGLLELTALRRIREVKSRVERTNPVEQAETFNRLFGELAALEAHRRALRDRLVGVE